MNEIQRKEIQSELYRVLNNMDIPEMRFNDLNWLDENIATNNQNHPNFNHAKWLIQKLRKGEQ